MRSGISSVYGFVALYLLVFAGIYAVENIVESQRSVNSSVMRQEDISSKKVQERLDVREQNGSLVVANLGNFPSQVVYLFERSGTSLHFRNISIQLLPGSVSSLSLDNNITYAGVVTSLGNTFVATKINQSCSSSSYTLTVTVLPKNAGYTEPQGILTICKGQLVQLQAFPLRGYVFLKWNGSLSTKMNPLTIIVNSSLVLTAVFVPSLTIKVFPEADGFSYMKNKTRVADVLVYGAPQNVRLRASGPSSVRAVISPSYLRSSINGTASRLYVIYEPLSYNKNSSITITATGEYNQTATSSYTISETPQDGFCCSSLAYNSFAPRLHHSAKVGNSYVYFMNTLYSEPGTSRKYIQLTYRLIRYEGWWNYYDYTIASNCQADTPIDIFSYGNEIAIANFGLDGLNFNIGTLSGNSISWYYMPSAVGYCSTGILVSGTNYPIYQGDKFLANNMLLSLLIDGVSNIWVAVNTYDPYTMSYHIELLKSNILSMMLGCTPSNCRSMVWDDVFISQPLSNQAVPSLFYSSGKLVLVYQVFSKECNPDNVFISTNFGASWSYSGSYVASGHPLCGNNSSGTVMKDQIYFGGVNSANQLSWWSLNLTSLSSFTPSSPYVQGAASGAMATAGSEVVLAYVSSNTVHVAYSYRPEKSWLYDEVVAYGYESVSFPSHTGSFQLILLCSENFRSPNPAGVSAVLITF